MGLCFISEDSLGGAGAHRVILMGWPASSGDLPVSASPMLELHTYTVTGFSHKCWSPGPLTFAQQALCQLICPLTLL